MIPFVLTLFAVICISLLCLLASYKDSLEETQRALKDAKQAYTDVETAIYENSVPATFVDERTDLTYTTKGLSIREIVQIFRKFKKN